MTLILGMIMGVIGVSKIVGAFIENSIGSLWLFLSGVVAVICSILIIRSWPLSSFWLVGTLVGIELTIWGLTLVRQAVLLKKEINLSLGDKL